MQKDQNPKLDAAMRAAEAYTCSHKTLKPGRILTQYGVLLRRAALTEAYESLRAFEDPDKNAADAARMAVAVRLMLAHAKLMETGHKMKINQSRLSLAHAANARAEGKIRVSHEEQPHGRRSRRIDYPILTDAEVDEILREKELRGQDPQR